MEYRIEDGQATIPLSEINRLNDLAEDLLKREEKFKEREKEFWKQVGAKKLVVVKTDYSRYGRDPVSIKYYDKEDLVESLVETQVVERDSKIEDLKGTIKMEADTTKHMSEATNKLYEKFDIPMLDVASGAQAFEHAIDYLMKYKWKRKGRA
ncbi:hypothetical protein KAR91_45520 [Candidatus Pacearchaeota archaeon]|nr:hypothetical protein [Candidatus Pacearchaeota archaeon]